MKPSPVDRTSNHSAPQRQKKKSSSRINHWTLMIYHAGDAGLSEEFVWSYKEMLKVGTPKGVEVVALADTVAPQLWMFNIPSDTPGRQDGSMFVTGKAGSALELGLGKNRHETGDTNMASPALLRNFVHKCIQKHPARHYMLILSGHGSGMIGKTFLQDLSAGRYMSIPSLDRTLGQVVKEIAAETHEERGDSRIDILGFDACGMMTAEIAHLLREDIKYMVSGEGFMTLQGWPYHEILRYLNDAPKAEPEALAKETVRRCVRYYADFARVGQAVDLAACELNGDVLNRLTGTLRALSERLRADIKGGRNRQAINAVIAAHWYAQSYAHEQYVDLRDFCEQLQEAYPDYAEQCEAVIAGIRALVKRSCYAGSDYQNSHGLSLYFPWVATVEDLFHYCVHEQRGKKKRRKTPFNEATGWGDFLCEFIDITRRKARLPQPRGAAGEPIFMPPGGYSEYLGDYLVLRHAAHRDGFPNLVRDSFPNIVRDSFPNIVRDSFPNSARDSFPNLVRDSFPNLVRDSFPSGARDSFPSITRNGQLLGNEPIFKNQALVYYEDECDS